MKGKLKDFFELNPTQNTNRHKDFINYIDTASVENGVLTNIEFLSCNFPSRAQRIVKYDDILYSTVRPNLRHYYHYGKNYDHLVASTGFVLIRNKNAENYSTRFLFYYLSSNSVVRHLSNIAELSQSTFPSFSPKDLGKIDLPELTIEKQTKIASILSAYDDLIENNNKRIKILKQIAENLYKEWFVRFRFPGHETAEFENGIPKGWDILRMENFCYVTDGTHDTPKETNLGVPLVTGRCIRNGFVDYDEAYLISEDDHNRIKKRSGLKSGDILFSNIGTVGNTCLVDYEREFSVKNVIIFKPPIRAISAYLYYWLISPSMQAIFSTQTNGASQQFVGLTFMRRIKILVPNKYIMTSFEKNVAPIIDAMMMLHKENQNLIKQRDLLLPRLMSGKLEVEM